jgi:lipoyl(octanoyl) transferase
MRIPLFEYPDPMDYGRGLALQKDTAAKVASGELPRGALLILSHLPVVTLGKNAGAELTLGSTPRHVSDRGGKATAHEPGQLVCYPILPMTFYGLGPRDYVGILCQSVICLLAEEGILAREDPDYPGVWVGDKKICAVGIRIENRITSHGLALNVSNSLDAFQGITPCGILDRGVTTMGREKPGQSWDLMDLGRRLGGILDRGLSL